MVCPPRSELKDEEAPILVDPSLAAAYSVHEIKGWTRAVAMHLTLLCVEKAGAMDVFLEDTKKKETFATQQGNYMFLPEDEVGVNRGRMFIPIERARDERDRERGRVQTKTFVTSAIPARRHYDEKRADSDEAQLLHVLASDTEEDADLAVGGKRACCCTCHRMPSRH